MASISALLQFIRCPCSDHIRDSALRLSLDPTPMLLPVDTFNGPSIYLPLPLRALSALTRPGS